MRGRGMTKLKIKVSDDLYFLCAFNGYEGKNDGVVPLSAQLGLLENLMGYSESFWVAQVPMRTLPVHTYKYGRCRSMLQSMELVLHYFYLFS